MGKNKYWNKPKTDWSYENKNEDIEEQKEDQEQETCKYSLNARVIDLNGKRLNVRKSPTTDSEVVCVLSENDSLFAEDSDNSEWYHVVLAVGVEGYTMKKYIKMVGD